MPTTDKNGKPVVKSPTGAARKPRVYPVVYPASTNFPSGYRLLAAVQMRDFVIGSTFHLTEADRAAFEAAVYAGRGDKVPDTYERISGSARIVDVDAETYAKIKKSKNGIRTFKNL